MVLETRHDYGDDLDAYENVIVKASGLAVVEELSIRCAVQRLVSEERFPLAVHPRSRLRTADGVPATQSAAHTVSFCFHWNSTATYPPGSQSASSHIEKLYVASRGARTYRTATGCSELTL